MLSTRLPAAERPGSSDALLATLAQFTRQRFATDREVVRFILQAMEAQLEVRTLLVAATLGGKFEVLEVVNRQGCALEPGAMLPLPDTYCNMVVGSGEPFVVEDSRRHPTYARLRATHEANIGTYIGAPLRFSDSQVVGTLCGVDPDPHAYSPQQVQFLQVLARLLATTLERNLGVALRMVNMTVQNLQSTQAMLRCVQHTIGCAVPGAPAAGSRERNLTGSSPAAQSAVLFDGAGGTTRPPLALVLEEAGYTVVELRQPPTLAAVEQALSAHKPALLALTAPEPVEPILDLVRQIRQQWSYQHLPLFLLTKQRLHALKAYHAGVSQCLYGTSPEACRAELQKIGDLTI